MEKSYHDFQEILVFQSDYYIVYIPARFCTAGIRTCYRELGVFLKLGGLAEGCCGRTKPLVHHRRPTVEDWTSAVRVRLGMDQRREGYGSLTWASLTAPANFERWLLEGQKRSEQRAKQNGRAPVTSHPTQSGVIDLKARFAKETP